MAEQIPINAIQVGEPFVSLFRIHEENYNDILRDMSENGFDQNEPLLIWEEENTLIDGHTRLKAAKELCIEEVPTLHLSFESENDAVWYSVKRNANRRSVTKGDKLRLVRILDNPANHGGNRNPEGLGGKSGKIKGNCQNSNLSFDNYNENSDEATESAKETAKIIGVGHVTITKMRTINKYATQDTIDAVENEEMSIDAAWKEAKAEKEKIEAERSAVKHFNRTTDSIEWALWTWNPITGCKHGCKYCYARDIAERFYPQGFEPTFHEARLSAPQDTPIPKLNKKEEPDNKTENDTEKTEITKEEKIRNELGEHNVFVCSMADLFGEWVPDEWIQAVFNSIETAPSWWNFLLLTKNPERYLELEFPPNCWIGATATNQEQMDRAITTFTKLREQTENVLFLSCEPLMDEIEANLSCVDWLIIGGRSRSNKMPAGQPEWKWVAKLMHCADQAGLIEDDRVYWKPNLTVKPKGYPIKLEE